MHAVKSFENDVYASWDDFFVAWKVYVKSNFLRMRTRDSRSTAEFNRARVKNGLSTIPKRFSHAYKVMRCVHGCTQKPRGKGLRQKPIFFRGCGARIHAEVVHISPVGEEPKWVIQTRNEFSVHNHYTSKPLAQTYTRGRDVNDPQLLESLQAFQETNTETKQVADWISTHFGESLRSSCTTLSSQQIRNVMNRRFGSISGEESVKTLLRDFVSMPGNLCMLLQNSLGMTSSIIVQSIAQRGLFTKWGDNLLLDWTHNTNNVGFYLVYALGVTHREFLEKLFRGLVYASSDDLFMERLAVFRIRAEKISPEFAAYIDKNWAPCSDMWSNFGRGRYFSAGNTTTNRIESNWNQFKALLGKKTSLVKCLRALFQHQVCVLRQLTLSMSLFAQKAFVFRALPPVLGELSSVLSPYCLRKVKHQWDYAVVGRDKWDWTREVVPAMGLKFQTCTSRGRNIQVTIDDHMMWICSCLFFTSTRLPCQHLLHVVTSQLNMHEMPAVRVFPRWNMLLATEVAQLADDTIEHLNAVRGGDMDALLKRRPSSPNGILYVKLNSRQSSEKVVLSECEKFNILQAELAPMVDSLKRLPTNTFSERFDELQTCLAGLREKWSTPQTDEKDSTPDESDVELEYDMKDIEENYANISDHESDSDTADDFCMDAPFVAAIEDDAIADSISQPSQVSLPDLSLTTLSQDIICAMGDVVDAAYATDLATSPVIEDDANEVEQLTESLQGVEEALNTLVLPRAHSGNTRKTGTQRKKFSRLAVVGPTPRFPANVADFVAWVVHTPDLGEVKSMMDKYPYHLAAPMFNGKDAVVREKSSSDNFMHTFVVPEHLVTAMDSALVQWRKRDAKKDAVMDLSAFPFGNEPVVFLSSVPLGFSEICVSSMRDFHYYKRKVEAYEFDLFWLQQSWDTYENVTTDLFDESKLTHVAMAEKVVQLFRESWIRRVFYTKSHTSAKPFAATFGDMIGRLARKERLNDVVVNFGLQAICSDNLGCYAVDSVLVSSKHVGTLPAQALSKFKYIVVPIHLATQQHWTVQIVTVVNHEIVARLYDPLGSTANTNDVENVWDTFTKPFLQNWYRRDQGDSTAFLPDTSCKLEWIEAPRQPDGSSCGLFCLAQVYSVITRSMFFEKQQNVSRDQVAVMR
ncbi:hypothetical protein BBJ28_00022550 [Nothophytophthora sp. Chile5]|nr:hypothetical protein BBJ28_00022550 [Nothophytophthora sp. Chile5]